MYWIYFIIFIAVALVPVLVQGNSLLLDEEIREMLLILCFGAFGLFLYILKEKSILKHVKEKLLLQKATTNISKDLSQSYSYIGEVNRKVDILTKLLKRMPALIEEKGKKERLMWEIIDVCKLVNRTERVSVRCISPDGHRAEYTEAGAKKFFEEVKDETLLSQGKRSFDYDRVRIVRSQALADGRRLYFLFERATNDTPDEELLTLLCSFALVVEALYTEQESHEDRH